MATPVSNTITSTTSATQDLEIFKNYPTEKNNKLLQKKYGSEDEFFKKVAAEGYAEGFKGQELNLPATQMLDETAMKQFLDPSGLSAYKGTELERYAGTQDLTENIPTMQSTFPEGQEIPIEEIQRWGGKDKSGVTSLGKLWNEAGGEYAMPPSYPSMSTEKDRIRQAKEAELYGINATGQSTGAPTYTDVSKGHNVAGGISLDYPQYLKDKRKKIEGTEPSIYNKRLNDGMMYSDGEMRKQGFSEDQIKRANQMDYSDGFSQFEEEPDHDQRRKEQSQLYGLDATGISAGAPKDKTGIKSIEKVDEKKSDLSLIESFQEDLKNLPEKIEKAKEAPPLTTFGTFVESFKEDLKSQSEYKERAAEVGYDVGPAVNVDEFKEIEKREDMMKKAELLETGDPDAGIKVLEKYVDDLKKKDKKEDKPAEVTVELPVPGDRMPPAESGAHEDLSLVNALFDKAETKEGLGDGERGDLIENLKDKGVKTKGLTDKNMLLIAMGLGMMASQKPGLAGVGEGGLAGLKVVAPLMKEKGSDYQLVEVQDPNNPSGTVIAKINKKTGAIEYTEAKGKGKLGTTEEKILALSKYEGISEKDVAASIRQGLTNSKSMSRESLIASIYRSLKMDFKKIGMSDEELINVAISAADKVLISGTDLSSI